MVKSETACGDMDCVERIFHISASYERCNQGEFMAKEILSVKGVTKRFPGVLALSDVSFTLREGEIHALVGANGAGKSTLIKTLAGAYLPEEGTIEVEGKPVSFQSPNEAAKAGIAVIYQEFNLFPEMDIARNIYFGMEPRNARTGFIDWDYVYRMSGEVVDRFQLGLDVREKVKNLSVAQQQMVEIAKALARDTRILIMDEPTATLTMKEVNRLFQIIEDLKKRNVSIIYISHRLDEIMQISDRMTVLRNGKVVGGQETKNVTKEWVINAIVGENLKNQIVENPVIETKSVLQVEHLSNAYVHDINFELREGEVLGIAGLVGAGRTELVRALFGADRIDEGTITVKQKKCRINKPGDAIKKGIGLLPESRKEQGLHLNLNIRRNISYASLAKFTRGLFIRRSEEEAEARKQIGDIKIVTPSSEFMVVNLSGGNQQKVVLGKWLCADSDILILDEPTRGVDVGAKEEIFLAVRQLIKKGKSVIFISSELEEVLRVSNRILTMYKGRITAEMMQKDATMDKIMNHIIGGDLL